MKKNFLYIVLFFIISGISGQEKFPEVKIDTTSIIKKQFDKNSIEDYKNDAIFDYSVNTSGPSLYEQISNWLNRVLQKILSWFFDDIEAPFGFIKSFLKLLPYIIAVVVLYLIINFFLKINSRNIISGKSNKEIVHLQVDEELLHSKDLPTLIHAAVASKNYRLATRYQYVLLLQKLSNKELIVWEQQKTNEDYSKELQDKNIHVEFDKITQLYDYVWYGNFEINDKQYLKGMENVQKIEHKIK